MSKMRSAVRVHRLCHGISLETKMSPVGCMGSVPGAGSNVTRRILRARGVRGVSSYEFLHVCPVYGVYTLYLHLRVRDQAC